VSKLLSPKGDKLELADNGSNLSDSINEKEKEEFTTGSTRDSSWLEILKINKIEEFFDKRL